MRGYEYSQQARRGTSQAGVGSLVSGLVLRTPLQRDAQGVPLGHERAESDEGSSTNSAPEPGLARLGGLFPFVSKNWHAFIVADASIKAGR